MSITMNEAKKIKKELEDKITAGIKDFERKTSLTIREVLISRGADWDTKIEGSEDVKISLLSTLDNNE